jgi:D-alanyl-lipoteichoic acid acyltransferase DltB (MBOAT superfamily)
MLFTDPAYLFLFLPLSVVAFSLLFHWKGRTAALGGVFLLSCMFYAGWGSNYLTILIVSILVNWACAHMLLTLPDDVPRLRSAILYTGQVFNFGALIWFKYSFFLAHFTIGAATLNAATLAIPVGISFYTFQQAVFLVDAFHRNEDVIQYLGETSGAKGKARGFLRYAAFICFFPQLVIGPIVYLKEFAPQVAKSTFGRIRREDLEIGLFILAAGLFKKVVLADNLGEIADPIFYKVEGGHPLSNVSALCGALAYYGQLYFDFSGYSDMAIGSARLFGLVLPINFDSPLKAVGIIDFYKRWHITLTRVIARFLYIPISLWGMRQATSGAGGPIRQHTLSNWLPLLINFEVIALWHGAAGTFIAFGVIHGLWYVLETEIRATTLWKRWRGSSSDLLRAALGRVVFTVPMVLCFALFRADSLDTWWRLIGYIFIPYQGEQFTGRGGSWAELLIVLGGLAFIWFLPNVYDLARGVRPGIETFSNRTYALPYLSRLQWRPNAVWGLTMAAGVAASLYYIGRLPPFLYLGF